MSDILFTTFSEHNLTLPFMLHGLGMNHVQEPVNRPMGIPLYQWIQCMDGKGTLHIDHKEYIVKPGQGMFLHPEIPHVYQSLDSTEPWVVHFINFKGYGIPPLLENTQLHASGVFTINEPEIFVEMLKQIYRSGPLPPIFTYAKQSSELYNLLLHLLLHTTANNGTNISVQNQRIAPIIAYIEEHYSEPIFLDIIANLCGLSEEYLCQLFKKTTGLRIFEYIQQTRIKHSKELLIEMPDLPVHIIGQLCGFNSSSYYNKIFKKVEHLSPGDFRKQNGVRSRK